MQIHLKCTSTIHISTIPWILLHWAQTHIYHTKSKLLTLISCNLHFQCLCWHLSIYIYFQMGLHSNLQLWVITNIKEICAMFCCRMDAANHRVFVDSPSLEQPMWARQTLLRTSIVRLTTITKIIVASIAHLAQRAFSIQSLQTGRRLQ